MTTFTTWAAGNIFTSAAINLVQTAINNLESGLWSTPLIKTANYTMSPWDVVIVGEHATVAFSIALIPATGSGKIIEFSNVGAANMTLDPDAAETINGASTLVLAQWDHARLYDYAAGLWTRLG